MGERLSRAYAQQTVAIGGGRAKRRRTQSGRRTNGRGDGRRAHEGARGANEAPRIARTAAASARMAVAANRDTIHEAAARATTASSSGAVA